MQFLSFTVAIAALAASASALPQGSSLEPRYDADCVCNSPEAKQNGGCSVVKSDPTPGKPDLHFKVQCGKVCTVSVDGKNVRFGGISSDSSMPNCDDGNWGSYCWFDWYNRIVSVDCRS
ncbi:uncharacterized protein PG998_014854 [Apiospora kogelbergensis]|uniref:uncharacterized protein n=1 Tax=Apiospora kogelbergensis TaxID=1337665 RepID=UPI00312D71F3